MFTESDTFRLSNKQTMVFQYDKDTVSSNTQLGGAHTLLH